MNTKWSKGFKTNAIASIVAIGVIFVGLAAKFYNNTMVYDWAKVTFWIAIMVGIISTIVELVKFMILDIKVRIHEVLIRRKYKA